MLLNERWAIAMMLGSGILSGCSGASSKPLAATEPTLAGVESGRDSCSGAKDPLSPLIIEWAGTSKTELEATSQQGPVIVTYAGCKLSVLAGCKAGGSAGYELLRTTPVRERLNVSDENELLARLPLGVVSLRGELKQGTSLELDYVSVGQKTLKGPPTTLAGQCDGATHFVRSITVGAYNLSTLASSAAGAGVGAADAELGIDLKKKLARLRGAGDIEACVKAPASEGCNAALRISLSPLAVTGGQVAAAGFGQGLGAIPMIPDIGQIRETSTGSGGLASADVELLKLLQDAKRTDKNPQISSENKALAWDKLATYTGKNPYKEAALQRRDQWRAVSEAEARLREQVNRMCQQYGRDLGKLRDLQALDDEVVSKAQKSSYQQELNQIYSAWQPYLTRCDQRFAEAGTTKIGMLLIESLLDESKKHVGVAAKNLQAAKADLDEVRKNPVNGSSYAADAVHSYRIVKEVSDRIKGSVVKIQKELGTVHANDRKKAESLLEESLLASYEASKYARTAWDVASEAVRLFNNSRGANQQVDFFDIKPELEKKP